MGLIWALVIGLVVGALAKFIMPGKENMGWIATILLGIGETVGELFDVLADLRAIGCDVLTMGQYLAPTLKHVPVARFVPPQEFDELAARARLMGFRQVVAGPFVRSSYHADEMVTGHGADHTP